MDQLAGKVAVVTGGASGIGLALAQRFAAEGASVVVADIEQDALDAAASGLADEHGAERVLAVPTDVRHADALEALAAATFERFGTAHVVCNNAGVATGGLSWTVPAERWRWIIDVNLLGVVHGIRAFVPRMIEQGEGHVVNTASAAGLLTGPIMGPYAATKHAVVALSESLQGDLAMAGAGVGVSVLCPEWVHTRIADADRNLPDDGADRNLPDDGAAAEPTSADGLPGASGVTDAVDAETVRNFVRSVVAGGMEPADVAAAVVDAIRRGRFWILTHDTTLVAARRRWDAIASDGQPVFWGLDGGGA